MTLTLSGQRIAVTGATGSIGRALIDLLLQRGATVRAVVRRPDASVAPGAERVVADLDDPATLTAAFTDLDQLFLNTAGAVVAEGPQPMVAQQLAAIDAAIEAGVDHVVKVSAQGAVLGGPLANGAHALIEGHLTQTGIPATILQPNAFLQNLLTGVSTFTTDGYLLDPYNGAHIAYLDAADIATCAAVLLHPAAAGRGRTHILTGPQAITHHDIATALSSVLGRTIHTRLLTPGEVAQQLIAQGATSNFAESVASLSRDVAAGYLAAPTPTIEHLTGHPPTDLHTFIRRHAEQLRHVVPG